MKRISPERKASVLAKLLPLTTDSGHQLPVAPNILKRQFKVGHPNSVWVTDITYIRTGQGWLYLCLMLDLFNRGIVGWQTSQRVDRRLVCATLENALMRQGYIKNILIHSDRGSQYCRRAFRQMICRYDLRQSMSRRGNCGDNAVAESFFHTLKGHIVDNCFYKTRTSALKAIFEYIELYYNRVRRHSANGWLSPDQYEKQYYPSLEE